MQYVIFLLADLVLDCLYLVSLPFVLLLLKKEERLERLGLQSWHRHYDVLFHAASVGEINAIKPLLQALSTRLPHLYILLTCNTITGKKTAADLPKNISVCLAPVDVRLARYRQLKLTRPKLLVVTETEIWPNLLYTASRKHIPVIFINARMGERSHQRLLRFKPVLRHLGNTVHAILAQTDADAERYSDIWSVNVLVPGNLKYAVQLPPYDASAVKMEWGYEKEDKIIVFGSSRPGEEELILQVYDELKNEYDHLKLLLAPRHLNRLGEIKALLAGRQAKFYSQEGRGADIVILNELGHLVQAYALCDIAIIGGSFFAFGGHNPLEAAYYGKSILMGPYHKSCFDSVQKLQAAQAIIICDRDTLKDRLKDILNNPSAYAHLGINAKQVLADNGRTLQIHLDMLSAYLS